MPDPTAQDPHPSARPTGRARCRPGASPCSSSGYRVKTLPPSGAITYGNSPNPLDLSNFDAFVLPEPNVLFTAAEKTAILAFVHAGGGLFMISDHNGSDRNNDGADSVQVLNDLMERRPVRLHRSTSRDISSDNPAVLGVRPGAGRAVRHGHRHDHPRRHDGDPAPGRQPAVRARFPHRLLGVGHDRRRRRHLELRVGTGGVSGATVRRSTTAPGSRQQALRRLERPGGIDAALALNATAWLVRGSVISIMREPARTAAVPDLASPPAAPHRRAAPAGRRDRGAPGRPRAADVRARGHRRAGRRSRRCPASCSTPTRAW